MLASHSWPRWGSTRIQEVMRAQRDAYAHLNNNVLHHANKGVTINEIHNIYTLPESLKQQWAAHSYHGSEEHNSRAVINRYLGYWDANPTTLTPLSPSDSAPLYVEIMGGAAPILTKAKALIKAGQYLLATDILDKLVYAQPNNYNTVRICSLMPSNRLATKRKSKRTQQLSCGGIGASLRHPLGCHSQNIGSRHDQSHVHPVMA